jgi:hypothetical protein
LGIVQVRYDERENVMLDISAAKAIARAARFASSFESTCGNAGVAGTRKEPPLLTDRQSAMLETFVVRYLRSARAREEFRRQVFSRLSGAPGFEAVRTSITNTALEHGFSIEQVKQAGVIITPLRNREL